VGRIVEVASRVKKLGCNCKGCNIAGWANGFGVGRIVEVDSRARIAGCS
jgi:hypothetical protein